MSLFTCIISALCHFLLLILGTSLPLTPVMSFLNGSLGGLLGSCFLVLHQERTFYFRFWFKNSTIIKPCNYIHHRVCFQDICRKSYFLWMTSSNKDSTSDATVKSSILFFHVSIEKKPFTPILGKWKIKVVSLTFFYNTLVDINLIKIFEKFKVSGTTSLLTVSIVDSEGSRESIVLWILYTLENNSRGGEQFPPPLTPEYLKNI